MSATSVAPLLGHLKRTKATAQPAVAFVFVYLAMPVDEIRQMLEAMRDDINHIRDLMDGKDTPERGMIVRLDRLEQKQVEAEKQRIDLAAAVKNRQALIWSSIGVLSAAVIGSLTMCAFGLWFHYK